MGTAYYANIETWVQWGRIFWNYKLKYTNTADDTGAGAQLGLVGVGGNCTNVVITGSTSTLKKDYRNYGIVYLIGGILNMSFMEEHIP